MKYSNAVPVIGFMFVSEVLGLWHAALWGFAYIIAAFWFETDT